jgi:hypothetical protein
MFHRQLLYIRFVWSQVELPDYDKAVEECKGQVDDGAFVAARSTNWDEYSLFRKAFEAKMQNISLNASITLSEPIPEADVPMMNQILVASQAAFMRAYNPVGQKSVVMMDEEEEDVEASTGAGKKRSAGGKKKESKAAKGKGKGKGKATEENMGENVWGLLGQLDEDHAKFWKFCNAHDSFMTIFEDSVRSVLEDEDQSRIEAVINRIKWTAAGLPLFTVATLPHQPWPSRLVLESCIKKVLDAHVENVSEISCFVGII